MRNAYNFLIVPFIKQLLKIITLPFEDKIPLLLRQKIEKQSFKYQIFRRLYRFRNIVKFGVKFLLTQASIILMLINTNSSRKDEESIDFIRKLARTVLESPKNSDAEVSLDLSESHLESHEVDHIINSTDPLRQGKWGKYYVSPYKQHNLSISRISQTRRQIVLPLLPNDISTPRTPSKPKKIRQSLSSASKYRQMPSLFERVLPHAADRVKTEARLVYQIKQRQPPPLSQREHNKQWADFLLRERKFEEEKKNKVMQHRQNQLFRQQLSKPSPPKPGPGMNFENIVRKMKREKQKLEQQLRSLEPNHLRWQSCKSPSRSKPARIKIAAEQAAFLI